MPYLPFLGATAAGFDEDKKKGPGFFSKLLPDFSEQEDLLKGLGDENQAFSKVMDARGENPGIQAVPELQGKSPSELALLDRISSGQQARKELGFIPALVGGVTGIAPYEALKGIEQNVPGAGGLVRAAGKLIPGGTADEGLTMGSSTSPASLKNVYAYLYGALRGR